MAEKTTDHEAIRKWAEARGGRPARVSDTGGSEETGILRLDFGERDGGLEPITWEEFFAKFEESNLALLYEHTPNSRFNKLVRR